jgi:hypothetical protein
MSITNKCIVKLLVQLLCPAHQTLTKKHKLKRSHEMTEKFK